MQGDAQLAFDTVVHNFDGGAFYTKWIQDLADTQAFINTNFGSDGGFPDFAPWYGTFGLEADPGWGIAAWNVPLGFASYYDDEALERSWYPHAKSYMEHWIKLANNNSGVLPPAPIGDWGNLYPGPKGYRPASYSQYFLVAALDKQAALAHRLGFGTDATRYSEHASAARAVYIARFYNNATACYGNCTDVEQIFGLALQLQEDGSAAQKAVWQNALQWFDTNGKYPERFGGGIISLKLVYPLLDKFGRSDLGLRFQLHKDAPPSFGYWIAQNATTLWEFWTNSATTFDSGLNSYNHIMYGGSGSWYYSTLAGLQRAPGSRSWSDLVIAPPASSSGILADLTWANASIDTPMGLVTSAWSTSPHSSTGGAGATPSKPKRTKVVYSLVTVLPPNARARVTVPTLAAAAKVVVAEGGRTVWQSNAYVPGVAGIASGAAGADGESVVFSVGSGQYHFAVSELD